jgi:23S rRNA pseudouridine955/2504/2580 synthase
MRSFTADETDTGKRCDRFLLERLSGTPSPAVFKAFRKRSVKVNGKRVKETYVLEAGDIVEAFIPEEHLAPKTGRVAAGSGCGIRFVYEDDYIIVVFKPQGIPVHKDDNRDATVLDEYVAEALSKRGAHLEPGFPALCHRIDRNTGGLVILAKDAGTLEVMLQKFRRHEIGKFYLACVHGIPAEREAELTAYLKKDSKSSHVMIYDNPVRGSSRIITRYRVLKALYPYSLLEVEIVTGKTHQIRAHLAYMGYPVLGDGKYGMNSVNRALRLTKQALFSYRLAFGFRSESAHLDYLRGVEITLDEIPWEEGVRSTGLIAEE